MSAWAALVRCGFRLLYNEFAFTYDAVSAVVSMGAWRCWGRSALAHLPSSGTILELAHGTGNLQLDLHAGGWRSIGYDLSPAMGRISQRKLRAAGLPIRLARGMAQQLPFPSGRFSAVVATFPTEFIVDPATLREVWRVLAPSGVLVIVPGAVFTAGGVGKAALEWLYRITGQRMDVPTTDTALEQLYGRHGFEVTFTTQDCPRSRAIVIIARKRG